MFFTNPGISFTINSKESEYEIRTKYAIILYKSRFAFEVSLEMGDLEEYATERYLGYWN